MKTKLNETLVESESPKLSYSQAPDTPGINQWTANWTVDLQKKIEAHWWNKLKTEFFDEKSDKQKFYILSMFPYPSGNLHMGHVRVYSIGDALARYHRLKGRNVLHPMGWDAFGLPAENAAIDMGANPEEWTQRNIANMKSLMEELNLSFDWSREFATCDSDYYKWTQLFFLKLYENDLIYKKKDFVNWDPVDQTVLADEQVDENGRSWRSGALVEKKLLTQWFIRTSRYSSDLYDGLNDPQLTDWKEVKKVQEEWLGEIKGAVFDFEFVGNDLTLRDKNMMVWLEKPEYIHKVKYVAVHPESVWNSEQVVSGILPYKVRNPMSGEVISVFVTDFFSYPTATENHAGIPEIYENDKLYATSINLSYEDGDEIIATEEELVAFRRKICEEAQKLGVGGHRVSPKVRDWLISRQRYWGTPIPIVYCEKCGGPQPVPEKDLPVKLPAIKRIKRGRNPLREEKEWLETVCPKCGGPATRETDTLDTFVDSSWYFLRFLDPDNVHAPFSVDKAKKFMPVDLYVGGVEHAVLHLYYARFFNHFLYSAGLLPQREPFRRLLLQGIVRGKTYQMENSGQYVHPDMVKVDGENAFHAKTGEKLKVDWQKMSKSKHNGVAPEKLLKKYGSDVLKLMILADVGPKNIRDWSEQTFVGIINWQSRVWSLVSEFIRIRSENRNKPPEANVKEDESFFDCRNYCLDMVNFSFEVTLNLSVAISKMQSLTKDLRKASEDGIAFSLQYERALAVQIILLAPLAPCFASELWCGFASAPNRLNTTPELQWDKSVFEQSWPKLDPNYVSKFGREQGTFKQRYDVMRKKKLKEMKAKEKERMG